MKITSDENSMFFHNRSEKLRWDKHIGPFYSWPPLLRRKIFKQMGSLVAWSSGSSILKSPRIFQQTAESPTYIQHICGHACHTQTYTPPTASPLLSIPWLPYKHELPKLLSFISVYIREMRPGSVGQLTHFGRTITFDRVPGDRKTMVVLLQSFKSSIPLRCYLELKTSSSSSSEGTLKTSDLVCMFGSLEQSVFSPWAWPLFRPWRWLTICEKRFNTLSLSMLSRWPWNSMKLLPDCALDCDEDVPWSKAMGRGTLVLMALDWTGTSLIHNEENRKK